MKINIEVKKSICYISWENVNADFYKVYCLIEDKYTEITRVYKDTFTTLSLLPLGINQCYVEAIKNNIIIDSTISTPFIIEFSDVVSFIDNNEKIHTYFSSNKNATGYRLYVSDDNENFRGSRNVSTTVIDLDNTNQSYKIKPITIDENRNRVILGTSYIFKPEKYEFSNLTLHKSYNSKYYLSWQYSGRADGFFVYSKNYDYPIYRTTDGKKHYVYLSDFRQDAEFVVKAFVTTPTGEIVVATSDYVKLSERKTGGQTVSLIIPAYNAQNYIARSIDSSLASNFDDLEIIIVNDGSTDNTQKVIDWYKDNYSNIVSIIKKNGGVAHTRNVGIERARGEYIAFMDNDDIIPPTMLSSLYECIKQTNTDIAIAPLYRLVDKGYTVHCNLNFEPYQAHPIDEYLEILYTPGFYNCAIWNKLYKAELVKAHPLGLLKYEDVSWTPCILSHAQNFSFVPTPFYEWDRRTRPETFGDVLAKMPEDELFEHRKQAMMFFINNGNKEKLHYLKNIAVRRLMRYSKNSTHIGYKQLMECIATDEYVE